ncbi:hypothetical protein HOD08_02315 [bacterium]|nr:hypothetical protein [bacterium]
MLLNKKITVFVVAAFASSFATAGSMVSKDISEKPAMFATHVKNQAQRFIRQCSDVCLEIASKIPTAKSCSTPEIIAIRKKRIEDRTELEICKEIYWMADTILDQLTDANRYNLDLVKTAFATTEPFWDVLTSYKDAVDTKFREKSKKLWYIKELASLAMHELSLQSLIHECKKARRIKSMNDEISSKHSIDCPSVMFGIAFALEGPEREEIINRYPAAASELRELANLSCLDDPKQGEFRNRDKKLAKFGCQKLELPPTAEENVQALLAAIPDDAPKAAAKEIVKERDSRRTFSQPAN